MSKRFVTAACIATLFFSVCITAHTQADTILDAFEQALAKDVQYTVLNITLDTKYKAIERANLPQALSFGADATVKLTPLSLTDDAATLGLVITPGVEIGLPEPMATSINVGLPVTISKSGSSTNVAVNPGLSVSQPLNKLLGLEPSERAAELTDLYTIEDARYDAFSRMITVKKNVLSSIKAVYSAKLSRIESERTLEAKERELERTRSIGELKPESIQYRRIELAATRARRAAEDAVLAEQKAIDAYELLTGSRAVPEEFTFPEVVFPTEADVERNPAVFLAMLKFEQSKAALELLEAPFIPRYSLGASYKMTGDFDDPGHTVGGGFSAAFEDFSVSAGVESAITDDTTVGGSLTLSFSLPDNRAKNLRIAENTNSVEIAALQLEAAKFSYRSRLADLLLKLDDLERRLLVLDEDRSLETQAYTEMKERNGYGLASDIELDAAKWGVDALEFTELMIAIDAHLLLVDIEALVRID